MVCMYLQHLNNHMASCSPIPVCKKGGDPHIMRQSQATWMEKSAFQPLLQLTSNLHLTETAREDLQC